MSEEKMEQLLSVLTDTMKNMQTVHADNTKMQSEMMKMMMKQMELQEASMNAGNHADQKDESSHTSSNLTAQNKLPNRPKPSRPVIEMNIDDIEWSIFLDKWSHYKSITEMADDKEMCLELKECCSSSVHGALYRFVGPEELSKDSITEEEMLLHIKSVAVKTIHEDVHRWNYHQMSQQTDEPISNYVGRLKAQAGLCKFNVECRCGNKVSYADEVISQNLVSGLANAEHQSRIISEATTHTDLKSKIDRLISLETTDDATSKMGPMAAPSRFGAMRSQYAKSKKMTTQATFQAKARRDPSPSNPPSYRKGRFNSRGAAQSRGPAQRRCRGCGRTNHGNGKPLTREECPSYGKTCDVCHLKNHFAKVCGRRQTRVSFVRMDDDTSGSETDMSASDYSDYEDENETMHEEHPEVTTTSRASSLAVRAADFRRGHRPQHRL
jgi:hypothetical protein